MLVFLFAILPAKFDGELALLSGVCALLNKSEDFEDDWVECWVTCGVESAEDWTTRFVTVRVDHSRVSWAFCCCCCWFGGQVGV